MTARNDKHWRSLLADALARMAQIVSRPSHYVVERGRYGFVIRRKNG